MNQQPLYLPKYATSRALVIGIDQYPSGPLIHACNDANAVANALIDKFDFPTKNVTLLLNGDATKAAITKAFLSFAETGWDDRVFVFFAGHGFTKTGRYGESGFLVPADGQAVDLSSLLRWDELTRNAELVPAKHVLFVMDACYGGLALKRKPVSPGSMRLLKDMLQRYTRQVLTAGKADEPVSDGGGTRPGHSIFTSHLLDGLDGAAAAAGSPLTANGLMAYVYEKVGGDPDSHQTPHFGFLDGDGDFIFDTSALNALQSDAAEGQVPEKDLLIKTPAINIPLEPDDTVENVLKRLLPDPAARIRLDDCITELIKTTVGELSPEEFPAHDAVTPSEFTARIQRYESAVSDLELSSIVLARWAEPQQLQLLQRILQRVGEVERHPGGTVLWIRLSWYPLMALIYAAGLSAVAAQRWDALHSVLCTPIFEHDSITGSETQPVIVPTVEELVEIYDSFKMLPDMGRKLVARSEHLYKKMQPLIEDQFALGQRYDNLFDDFEILLALTYVDLRNPDLAAEAWAPPGRFSWKESGHFGRSPVYTNFIREAKLRGDDWPVLKAGFFEGSRERFAEVAESYGKRLAHARWF